MLHEIILLLAGNTSGLFIEKNGQILLHPSVQPLHPGERELINDIVSLASKRKRIERYIEIFDEDLIQQNQFLLKALRLLLSKKLFLYDESLANLERMIISSDPYFVGSGKFVSLAQLEAHLADWKETLSSLLVLQGNISQCLSVASTFQKLHNMYMGSTHLNFKKLVLECECAFQKTWLDELVQYLVNDSGDDSFKCSFLCGDTKDFVSCSNNVPFLTQDIVNCLVSIRTCMLNAKKCFTDAFCEILRCFYRLVYEMPLPLTKSSVTKLADEMFTLVSEKIIFQLASFHQIFDLVKMLEMVMLLENVEFLPTLSEMFRDVRGEYCSSNDVQGVVIDDILPVVLRKTISLLDLATEYGECVSFLKLVSIFDEEDEMIRSENRKIDVEGLNMQLLLCLKWPFNLFMDKNALNVYSDLWILLGSLHLSITKIKSLFYERKEYTAKGISQPWTQLWVTLWFLSSLQYYAYECVIKPSYCKLRESLTELYRTQKLRMQDCSQLHALTLTYAKKMLFFYDDDLHISLNSIYHELSLFRSQEVSKVDCQLAAHVSHSIECIRQKENDPSYDREIINALIVQLNL
ncbi:gamma tubulin complex GCP4 subunit Gfh1 [Schizosaccharomyces pombe]|uniref:Gamma-tubulin complex component gfh1 n=1 Tax=Schizosaccharomyces pombe (strain 972 / ATCC 24843) TaxID=284812 RepID=GFH1_SCHPO|nr:gamma tubulin complex subunit Gfh1 [Schizosaccharomyces pombe]Q9P7R5.1 RecName: Full=Gamma-tubulin complex component gfh1; AltName: Full=Gcp4 homolog 1 [Schizosaccharomyces pombe 972h-]CAB75414.1 gamma tubulin complex subunit Gfh1 [Schizosaccharomyces pombe]|eukprot:NP_596616.1 gamma tubulin complex subunit Gfh1 [Schizosaccharomyces pombe]